MTGLTTLDRGHLISVRAKLGEAVSSRSQLGVVLSAHEYHLATFSAVIALVIDRETSYPFAVPLPNGFSGRTVLSDHVRQCSFDHYEMHILETVTPQTLHHVLGKLEAILRI